MEEEEEVGEEEAERSGSLWASLWRAMMPVKAE